MQEIEVWIPIDDKINFISKTLNSDPLENNEESENPIGSEC